MKSYSILLLLFISIGLSGSTMAQNADTSVYYEISLIPNGAVNNQYDTLYNATLNITLHNISNYSKVHVKVNRDVQNSHYLNENINLSGGNNLPQGVTLIITGEMISIGFGPISAISIEDIEIRTQDHQGNISEKIKERHSIQ